ncbi:hypothetical protein FACS189472_04230 [Alphaproteobacteria bacterium]|nr:hypothetical protein FACS189472_04230 [Alphaproteobacteria bacterium]
MEDTAKKDPHSIAAYHKAYVNLIDLLEKSAKNGMSKEQMDKILDVYEHELFYGIGFTIGPHKFMTCIRAYQDLSQLVKSWPKENEEYKGVLESYGYSQEWLLRLLRELRVLKISNVLKIGAFDDEDNRCAISDLLEYAYDKCLTNLFSYTDFFDKRIAESIEKNSFSPAIAKALYVKLLDMRLITEADRHAIPDVKVLSGNKFPGHILLVPREFDAWMDVYTLYVNKDGSIEKICIKEGDSPYFADESRVPMVKGNCFSVDYGADYKFFYKWDSNNGILTFLDHKMVQNHEDIKDVFYEKDFKFILEKKQWILHESRKVPYPYKGK